MSYKQKYIKYKIKYLELNKATNFMQTKIMTGGSITWATQEYIEGIISSKNPELTKCELIKDIVPKTNEGKNNKGIGFVTIEGKEYFLKYGVDLFKEFKTGYMLSKLKTDYPYFLNVYSLFKCDYIPIGNTETINGQVMIVDKGEETIYNYLNRKSKEYILDLIPDLHSKVKELDENITEIINKNLTEEEKKYEHYWQLENANKIIYDKVISETTELIKKFYLSLSREIIQFQTEFIPLFLQNYKTLIDSYMIVDIFTINRYNNFIGDKKSDNFMIKTEPYVKDKTHINIKIGSNNIRMKNVCEWHNTKEYCFIYPVDFGSGGDMDYPKLNEDLLPYFLNSWITSYSKLKLYSDNHITNLELGNILLLTGSKILFNFSKFSVINQLTKINLYTILEKYNPFIIKIFNPLGNYVDGIFSVIDDDRIELKKILSRNPLQMNDYRDTKMTNKFFNINTLEEASNILKLLLDGNTLKYDTTTKMYRAYGTVNNFSDANYLVKDYTFLSDDNVYKTFNISI